jgi:hypothetical protein
MTQATDDDYKDVFAINRQGAKVLDDLFKRFAKGHVTSGGIDAILQTYANNGAREVLEFIIKRINRADRVDEGAGEDGTI